MNAVFRSLLLLLLVTFTVSCASTTSLPVVSVNSDTIVKSPADNREYRSLTLGNGLKVMLVNDPKADRAAAALDVHVGSGNDPVDREGLAHYLEHMLFLGTKKYPESGEYQQYITQHGGSNNAYTVVNHTNYFFSITPDYLEGGLDRFAQFFIAPLFTAEYVTRERAIVDSEYQARKDDEGRRLWTARREVYNPEHPSTQFSVGSLKTLADRENDPVREDLIGFYERYYHAPRMALSVIGNQSLDQLQAWVEEKFSAIPGGGEPYQPFSAPLVLEAELPIQLTLKPIKETHQLSFSFPIESVDAYEASKPSRYLGNLLGHEGKGSLLALLKSRGWANGLSAGLGYSDDVQATFDIKISLSEQGFTHIDEIGELLFAEIKLIREKGIKQRYFDELRQLAEIDFRFQEKSSEVGLVQRLASQLHRYSAQEVLSAPYRYQQYNPQQIKAILARLTPENLQLIVVDPEFESEQKTDWYNVAYAVNTISPERLSAWKDPASIDVLSLPEANPFIAENLTLLDVPAELMAKPVLYKEVAGVDAWHQTRVDFKQPKAELYFSLRSNAANGSVRQAMLTEFYVHAVEEALKTYSYPASLAGLEYQIYRHSRGLSVRISGYSEKQTRLLEKIVDEMSVLEVDVHKYDLYSQSIRRSLENSIKGRPSDRVIEGVYNVVLTSSWSNQEKLAALKEIDRQAVNAHVKALLNEPQLVLLSVGNVSEADSLRAAGILAKLNTGEASQAVKRARVRKLPSGAWTLLNTPSVQADSAIALVYQGKDARIEALAATQLLGSLIRTPYYQTLRTQAQVGYIVSAFAFNVLDTPALGFSVQSNSHSVGEVLMQTREFAQSFITVISKMPGETFNSTKAGLIARIMQEDKQLGDVASRNWAEIDRQAYDFNTRARLVAAIDTIDQAGLQQFYARLIADDEAAVLLNYAPGALSAKIDLPASVNTHSADTLKTIRASVSEYFQTPE